ncbi:MAG: hypothetical protein H5U40_19275 [Polyangiaceae bacterium]|nr:hypothetical protein [Polyangiaceae bacterium]
MRDQGTDENDATRYGDVLGTVGYMSPEQMTDCSGVEPAADVYSLGAVLFYLLTLEPLHGRGSAQDRARSTQQGADARPSVRAPARDLPPELDTICVKATALDPKARYRTARELHDAIERYLEGDRDLRLRAELAERHVRNARAAAERVFAGKGDAAETRKAALREAGRAIALDPESAGAAEILTRLMLEPPKEVPEEVLAEIDSLSENEARRGALFGAFAVLSFAAATLLIVWLGVRSWLGFGMIFGSLVVAAVQAFYIALARPKRFGLHALLLGIPIASAIGATAGLAGAYILTPTFALAYAVIIASIHGLGKWRIWMVALGSAAFLFPAVMEWVGLLPSAYHFEQGSLVILPQLVEFHPVKWRFALLLTNFVTIAVVCGVLFRISAADTQARRQLQLHAWQLQQLAPKRPEMEPSPSAERLLSARPAGQPLAEEAPDADDTRAGVRSTRGS